MNSESGTVIMLSIPFSMISSKMLDGFGKSVYSLVFTFVKIILEMFLIYELSILLNSGSCVLIAMIISEVIFAIVNYAFLRYIFKHFDGIYGEKSTVKTFKGDEESSEDSRDETEEPAKGKGHRILRRIPLIIALVALMALLVEIILVPIHQQNYSMLTAGVIAFIIGGVSVYLMERLNQAELSAFGFVLNAILVFVFMGKYGYISTILFIVVGVAVLYIKVILKALRANDSDNNPVVDKEVKES